jgi:MFS family permease
MTPRLATFLVFAVNGAVVGTWVASIPSVQAQLGLSGTEFGLILFVLALGTLGSQQVTGQLLTRVSSRRMLISTGLIFPLLTPLPLLAPSPLALAIMMFAFGAFNTAMDVSMNAHGVALENSGGKSIFSGLHAGWSIGGFVGAGAVGIAVTLGASQLAEAFVAGLLFWVVVLFASRHLGVGSVRTEGAQGISLPTRAILPIALLVMLIALVEGGLTDWGGIYLRRGIGASAELAAFAYAALSLGLTIGRLGGDAVKDHIGSIRLIQGGMLLGAVAIATMLLVGNEYVALLGMVVAGFGIANAIPQLFGAAGRIPPHGPSLSTAFTFLTVAFMIGPPVIGVISDALGVAAALGLLVASSFVVAATVGRVPSAETNPRFRRS